MVSQMSFKSHCTLKKSILQTVEGASRVQFVREGDPTLELLDLHSKKRLCYLLSSDG